MDSILHLFLGLMKQGLIMDDDGKQNKGSGWEVTKKDLENVTSLLRRPWFHRTWVLQEAVLSQVALVMIGPCTVAWEVLYTNITQRFDDQKEYTIHFPAKDDVLLNWGPLATRHLVRYITAM
jgi:hypothetical protein